VILVLSLENKEERRGCKQVARVARVARVSEFNPCQAGSLYLSTSSRSGKGGKGENENPAEDK
jgi:hypothetical protein